MAWRMKKLTFDEWPRVQEAFAQLQMNAGGPEGLAMFARSEAGDTSAEIFITGPGIEMIEAMSPDGWVESQKPDGAGVSLLVGAGDPWNYFSIEKPY